MNTTDYAIGWVRAIIDGEGCVCVPNKYIEVANTELSVIEETSRCLTMLGIGFNVFYDKRPLPRKNIYHLRINRRSDVQKLADIITPVIPYKRDAMAKLVAFFNRPGQKRNRWWDEKPSEQELATLKSSGLSNKQIGEQLGISANMVSIYLRRYDIHQERRVGSEPDPDDVRRAYWDEGLSLTAMGKRFGYKGNGIEKFMRRHGIERRIVGRHINHV